MKTPCTYEGMEKDPTCEIEEPQQKSPYFKAIMIFILGVITGVGTVISLMIWLLGT
jgi:hypothetical protein